MSMKRRIGASANEATTASTLQQPLLPRSASPALKQRSSAEAETPAAAEGKTQSQMAAVVAQAQAAGGIVKPSGGMYSAPFVPLPTKLKWDRAVARKTLWINLNCWLGIVLMIVSLQVCWDPEDAQCTPNTQMEYLRGVISLTTLVLVCQIVDRRRAELEQKHLLWSRAVHNMDWVFVTHERLSEDGGGLSRVASMLARPASVPAHKMTDKSVGFRVPKSRSMIPPMHIGPNPLPSTTTSASKRPHSRGKSGGALNLQFGAPNIDVRMRPLSRSSSASQQPQQGQAQAQTTFQIQTQADPDEEVLEPRNPMAAIQEQLHEAGVVSWLSVLNLNPRRGKIHVRTWIALLICAWHPFPYASDEYANELALFMFLRLVMVLRLIRDNSEIWMQRHLIVQQSDVGVTTHHFDTWLAGYCIYIFEREYPTDQVTFTILNSIYLAVQCLVTGYANDSYNRINPTQLQTQLVCLTATVSGFFFTSFLIGVLAGKILPTRFEKQALLFLDKRKVQSVEETAAAKLIQLWWRHCLIERHWEEEAKSGKWATSEEYHDFYLKREAAYLEKLIEYRKEFGLARQNSADVVDQMGTHVHDPLTGVVAGQDANYRLLLEAMNRIEDRLVTIEKGGELSRSPSAVGSGGAAGSAVHSRAPSTLPTQQEQKLGAEQRS